MDLLQLAPAPPDPIEGTYKQVQCQEYEGYLAAIGTGPLSRVMVMRAAVTVSITQVQYGLRQSFHITVVFLSLLVSGTGQEVEDCHRDLYKGEVDERLRHLYQVGPSHAMTTLGSVDHSMTRKLTENKFKPGVAKPELAEDWDQVGDAELDGGNAIYPEGFGDKTHSEPRERWLPATARA